MPLSIRKPAASTPEPRFNRSKLPHIATRIFNTPLLIHPRKAAAILAVLGSRIGLENLPVLAFDDEPLAPEEKGYSIIEGIAQIPIYGTLVKRAGGLMSLSGMSTYEDLTTQIEDALTDPQVKGILFDVDSPGGEVSGVSTLGDFIYGQRGQKPMMAIANDDCYSAAYWLASCADQVLMTVDGGVGSIGCYMLHADVSKMDEMRGVTYTYIFAGDHKVDGHPHAPLNKDAESMMQDEVDRVRNMFVATVARNRGVTEKQVFDTQARVYNSSNALPLLADRIGEKKNAMTALLSRVSGATAIAFPENPLAIEGQGAKFFGGKARPLGILTHPDHKDDTWLTLPLLHDMEAERLALCEKFGVEVISRVERYPNATASAQDESQADAGPIKISMLVIPYDGSVSCNLGGFRERYAPGAFAKGLDGDVRALFNHDEGCILGRKSANTLTAWEDREGVHIEVEAPATQWAKDLITSMRRQDIRQSSAAFWILKSHWESQNGERIRVVDEGILREGSVHGFPAYETTQAKIAPAAEVQPIDEAVNLFQHEHDAAHLELLRVG